MTLAHTGRDAALAVVLAAAGVAEVVTGNDVGPRPVAALAVLAMTLPVAARARAPLAALGVAVTAGLLQALAGGSLSQSVAAFVAVLVLVYSVSSLRAGRVAAAGLAVALVGGWCQTLIETRTGAMAHEPGDYVFVALLIGAAWLGGYALRGRAHRIAGLEHETVRLAREREERAAAAVAEERARIARDLHDVVAHGVSVMVVQAAAAEEVLARDPERARAPLVAIQDTGAQALTEMRRLLGMLRADESRLARAPGLAGLNALADEFRHAGLPLEVDVEDGRPPLAPGLDLAAYRIVEEALTNALKHGGGASSRVSIRHTRDAIELEVSDDGNGPPRGDGTGHGLIGMRERAALYDGTVEAGPRAGGGFAVHARLPMYHDPGADRRRSGAAARWVPHAARGAGRHRDHRRGKRRRRGARTRPPAAARRRADGHPHAGDGRAGGHATSAFGQRGRSPRADPHHVRPRRVRVRRNAQRSERLPAQERPSAPAPRRDPDRRRRARHCSPRRSRSGSSRSSYVSRGRDRPRRTRSPS